MELRTVKYIRDILMAVLIAALLLAKLFQKTAPIFAWVCLGIGFAALIGDFVFCMIYWRCPSCGGHLRIRSFSPKHCEHCGAPLDDD